MESFQFVHVLNHQNQGQELRVDFHDVVCAVQVHCISLEQKSVLSSDGIYLSCPSLSVRLPSLLFHFMAFHIPCKIEGKVREQC